ncbi:MAG: glycosyltransferase family 2 protein [Planctomycetota bacterium]
MTDDLTVIAVAQNEAFQATEWLKHLSWVKRILVIDTGSRDGTVERLRAGGAEVIEYRPAGGLIHVAKNHALEQVKSGWVLDLDLDERVPDLLRHEILSVVNGGDRAPAPAGFQIPFRHYVFGRWLRHGGWRTKHLRLYRAGALRYGEDRAHSAPVLTGQQAELRNFVVHYAHPTVHDFLVKMNRYTSHDAPLLNATGRGGLRNRALLPARRRSWTRAALSVFWNRYIKAAGFRDGVPGFVVAVLLGAYAFIEQAKVWELRRVEAGASSDGVRGRDLATP